VTLRVYAPCTVRRLRRVLEAGGMGPAPYVAHTVTEQVRADLPDAGEEEREYVASATAAQSAVALLDADEPARRVVLALDVPEVRWDRTGEPTLVQVDEVTPLHRLAAVLADSADAEPAVAAAREAVARGAGDADELLDRCLDHELGWWGVQEVGALLAEADG
jgi:hypothetical protein